MARGRRDGICVQEGLGCIVDLRYVFASRSLEVKFDGAHDFGRSFPDTVYYGSDPHYRERAIWADTDHARRFGRCRSSEPRPEEPGANCALNPDSCVFVAIPDGQLDAGFYLREGRGD